MVKKSEHPWAFAGRVFASGEVEDACLCLQDDPGADVIVMLFFLWLGMAGRKLNAGDMQEILDLAEPWQRSAIRPLRRLRREVRNLEEDRSREIYTAMKASELALEKQELQVLWNAVSASGLLADTGAADIKSNHEAFARANLEMYLASLEMHQQRLEGVGEGAGVAPLIDLLV
ncbi:MAG: TIGR02444 family protein, partial [Sphingomonadales bacterium]